MLEKILKLIEAGYKHDEINAILKATAAPAAAQAPAPAPAPAPAVPSVPADIPVTTTPAERRAPAAAPAPAAPAPADPAGPYDMGAILAAIQGMGNNIVTALQRAQIGAATLTPPDPWQTVNEITAAIIDPPMKGDVK